MNEADLMHGLNPDDTHAAKTLMGNVPQTQRSTVVSLIGEMHTAFGLSLIVIIGFLLTHLSIILTLISAGKAIIDIIAFLSDWGKLQA